MFTFYASSIYCLIQRLSICTRCTLTRHTHINSMTFHMVLRTVNIHSVFCPHLLLSLFPYDVEQFCKCACAYCYHSHHRTHQNNNRLRLYRKLFIRSPCFFPSDFALFPQKSTSCAFNFDCHSLALSHLSLWAFLFCLLHRVLRQLFLLYVRSIALASAASNEWQ